MFAIQTILISGGGVKMKQLLLILSLFLLIIPNIISAEPIPEQVLDTVVYITLPKSYNQVKKVYEYIPIGTAFFVSHKYDKYPTRNYAFLVTAKHVLFEKNKTDPRIVLLRMNDLSKGQAKHYDCLDQTKWFFHPDDKSVDLAVQNLFPKDAYFKSIPSSMFMTNDQLIKNRIGIGDEVFYMGLLPHHAGTKRILPITRFGRLALMLKMV